LAEEEVLIREQIGTLLADNFLVQDARIEEIQFVDKRITNRQSPVIRQESNKRDN
jgi:hypothetical protein